MPFRQGSLRKAPKGWSNLEVESHEERMLGQTRESGERKESVQRKWSARAYPWKLVVEGRKVELFDLSSDPDELRDVSREHPERSESCRSGTRRAKKALRELGYIQ